MNIVSVVTGDVVGSSEIQNKGFIVKSLKFILEELERMDLVDSGGWEIYRGDSFQIALSQPRNALKVALLIRAGLNGRVIALRSPYRDLKSEDLPGDARMGIATGSIEIVGERVSESFGEAFTISGQILDRLSDGNLRMMAATADMELNAHLEMVFRMADVIISDWTMNSSQAIFRHLLYNEIQQEIADALQITQPSVQSRLKIGHLDEIEQFIAYFEHVIDRHLEDIEYGTH